MNAYELIEMINGMLEESSSARGDRFEVVESDEYGLKSGYLKVKVGTKEFMIKVEEV